MPNDQSTASSTVSRDTSLNLLLDNKDMMCRMHMNFY
jgi:hypothetical protein